MTEVKITASYDIDTDEYIISSDDVELYDIDDDIVKALKDMSVYYADVTYIGYIKDKKFILKDIINHITGKSILLPDIEEMYYEAFEPECIIIDC